MELIDHLRGLASRLDKQLPHVLTEEASKNALVLPFINALGYNVFDPLEVVPEFTCDASISGIKKGEKVDYAIKRGDEVLMLFECKHANANLDVQHASQLLRYFHVANSRVGVLTNGVVYRFFSDLEEPNRMDTRPFLEFDLRDLRDNAVSELKRLMKAHFDVDSLVESAREMKTLRELRQAVASEVENPSDDFVRLLASRVYDGRWSGGARDLYAPLVKRALGQYVTDRLTARLQSAIEAEEQVDAPESEPLGPPLTSAERERLAVDTTSEEHEGFYIVRALLRPHISVDRVFARDVQSYFGILLDNNNRKPICRLYLGGTKKYIEIFDTEGGERVQIESLDGIYDLADRLRVAATRYDAV